MSATANYVKNWFESNAMNPLFALSEFCRKHKVEAIVTDKEVKFHDENGLTEMSETLDGLVFEIGTWNFLRDTNVRSIEIPETKIK